MNEELQTYIKEQLALQIPRADIENTLIAQGGWSEADIDTAFSSLDNAEAGSVVSETDSLSPTSSAKRGSRSAILITIAVLVLGTIVYYVASIIFGPVLDFPGVISVEEKIEVSGDDQVSRPSNADEGPKVEEVRAHGSQLEPLPESSESTGSGEVEAPKNGTPNPKEEKSGDAEENELKLRNLRNFPTVAWSYSQKNEWSYKGLCNQKDVMATVENAFVEGSLVCYDNNEKWVIGGKLVSDGSFDCTSTKGWSSSSESLNILVDEMSCE